MVSKSSGCVVFLQVGLTWNKALRGAASLTIDGAGFPLEPLAAGRNDASGIRADLGDPRAMKAFHLGLVFNGAETLQITPVGRVSNVQMKSDRPHPSFFGAYLPNQRDITEAGFAANWSIPHLARNLPQITREDSAYSANEASFGVQFFQPNDFYQKAYRAARYGILFIALTFFDRSIDRDSPREKGASRAICSDRPGAGDLCVADGRLCRINWICLCLSSGQRCHGWIDYVLWFDRVEAGVPHLGFRHDAGGALRSALSNPALCGLCAVGWINPCIRSPWWHDDRNPQPATRNPQRGLERPAVDGQSAVLGPQGRSQKGCN